MPDNRDGPVLVQVTESMIYEAAIVLMKAGFFEHLEVAKAAAKVAIIAALTDSVDARPL